MSRTLSDLVRPEFTGDDLVSAENLLATLEPSMTMNSQSNLDAVISAILKLSQGDIAELHRYVQAAKVDFRDVIYWAEQ